jgi:hypothetical protein
MWVQINMRDYLNLRLEANLSNEELKIPKG